jgi:hypothetical protein
VRIAKFSAILFLLAMVGWPQNAKPQDSSAPQTGTSSAPSQGATSAGTQESAAPQEQPDTQPLGGGLMSTLGSLEGHSFLQPELSVGEEGYSNPGYIPGASKNFQTTTVAMGGLHLDLLGQKNILQVDYMGAGFIYNNLPSLDSQTHLMSVMDSHKFRRGVVLLGDDFSYTPNASFGFGGLGVLGGFGSGLSGGLGISSGLGGGLGGNLGGGLGGIGQINPMFGGNESILTTGYGASSNTAIAEAEYRLTARTSLTATGTFGTLQFGKGSEFLTGNNADGMVGLDDELTARDTIGAAYIYSTFHYAGRPEAFHSQMADFTYGRKVTGRLSFEAYGGPDFVTYTSALGQTLTSTYISGFASLNYALRRSAVGLYVGRYSGGGAGVVPGAETTTVSVNWERQVTRTWMANAYGGYSRNSGYSLSEASPTTTAATAAKRPTFNYWFGDLTLQHPLSRRLSLVIGYEYQRSSSSCTGVSCTLAPGSSNQVIAIGLTFVPRPFEL